MGHFRQYRPTFVDSDVPLEEFDFATAEELFAHPVLTRMPRDADFSHFAVSPSGYVLAVYDQGEHWFIVGSVSDVGDMVLPLFDPVAHQELGCLRRLWDWAKRRGIDGKAS